MYLLYQNCTSAFNIYISMKKILTLLLLLPTTAYAEFSDWDKKDKALFKTYITLNAIDTLQTWDMIDCQRYNYKCPLREKNVILGPTPNKTDVLMLKVATTYGIYHILDNLDDEKYPRARTITLAFVNSLYINTVGNNYQAGLRFGFAF